MIFAIKLIIDQWCSVFDTLCRGVWILFSSSWLNELWMGERSRGGWATQHELDKVTALAIYCRSMDLDFYQPDFTMESVEFFGEPKAKKAFRVASMRLPKVSLWPRFHHHAFIHNLHWHTLWMEGSRSLPHRCSKTVTYSSLTKMWWYNFNTNFIENIFKAYHSSVLFLRRVRVGFTFSVGLTWPACSVSLMVCSVRDRELSLSTKRCWLFFSRGVWGGGGRGSCNTRGSKTRTFASVVYHHTLTVL